MTTEPNPDDLRTIIITDARGNQVYSCAHYVGLVGEPILMHPLRADEDWPDGYEFTVIDNATGNRWTGPIQASQTIVELVGNTIQVRRTGSILDIIASTKSEIRNSELHLEKLEALAKAYQEFLAFSVENE